MTADRAGAPSDDRPRPRFLAGTPLVLDTDLGGDADDAFALAAAAISVRGLALVLTSDELPSGQRARFARHLLDQVGRHDVPLVAGPMLDPAGRRFCVADLIPPAIPTPPTDVLAAVEAVLARTDGPVRWVGCGPATNLAHVVSAWPDVATRLRVTQMGGAFRYRDPDRGEHNFRRDADAIRTALNGLANPQLVISDTTFTPEIQLTPRSALYQRLARPTSPRWARLLALHLDRWITSSGYPGSMMHDPLALSVALALPFVRLTGARVRVDQQGRMRRDRRGVPVRHSHTADYPAFRSWLAHTLASRLITHTKTAETI